MARKYSDLRKQILRKEKEWESESVAHFTHFLQAIGSEAESYYLKVAQEYSSSLVEEPAFEYEIPFEYDVPFPPPENPDFTFIDLFAGIGGFRVALQELNGKCVFSSEWNKYAKKTYEANFGEVPFGDITKVNENAIPEHDLLVGGFPCQPFSIAGVSKKNSLGKNHGFLDETQGTLFFDIARIIEAKRPKAILLENVKNLRSHDKGRTFNVIKSTLKELEYEVFAQVIDAKHYVPQHRERIFIVGFDKHQFEEIPQFEFPQPPADQPVLKEILEQNVPEKYTLTPKLWAYLQAYAAKHKAAGNGFGYGLANLDGVTRTLSARYYKDGSEVLIPQRRGENPRRLMPVECKRLMGYPEKYKITGIGVSDTQLYKQFGNSVAVPVVAAVAASVIPWISHSRQAESIRVAKETAARYSELRESAFKAPQKIGR